MHFHDVIFLALAVCVILLMVRGRYFLNSRSPVRRVLAAPVRLLRRDRDNGHLGG